jgi:hypothetical protein
MRQAAQIHRRWTTKLEPSRSTRTPRSSTVDAIVNAANTSLLGGGGIDGACRLSAQLVIHRVGPVWRAYSDETRATWNSTRIGEDHDETSAVSRFHRRGATRRVCRVGASALQHFVRKSRVPV